MQSRGTSSLKSPKRFGCGVTEGTATLTGIGLTSAIAVVHRPGPVPLKSTAARSVVMSVLNIIRMLVWVAVVTDLRDYLGDDPVINEWCDDVYRECHERT